MQWQQADNNNSNNILSYDTNANNNNISKITQQSISKQLREGHLQNKSFQIKIQHQIEKTGRMIEHKNTNTNHEMLYHHNNRVLME